MHQWIVWMEKQSLILCIVRSILFVLKIFEKTFSIYSEIYEGLLKYMITEILERG